MARVEVVDEFGGPFEFVARRVQAGALEEGDGLGFGAGVGFADQGPFLDGRADVAGLGFLGRVVHREEHDREARSRRDVVRGAGLDAPRAFEADVFGAGGEAEQERGGEEGFSE